MKLISPREILAWLTALAAHWKNARISRPRLLANQQRKFRNLVAFVNSKSQYYRAVIAEHGIDPASCVPEDFPVLTKDDVIENFDRIVTDPRVTRARVREFLAQSTDPEQLLDGQFHVLHTSGTSGTVGYFVFSHGEWIKGSSHIVRMAPLRIRRRIAYVAATHGHFAGVSLMLTGNHRTNAFFFDVRPFDVNMPLGQMIDALNEFQPQILGGYPASLAVLASAQQQGRLRITPSMVSTGGEPLLPATRAHLERVFRVSVADVYASSEHLYMGIRFPYTDGLYLLEEDLIFEFHNDHTCVTNLFNYTTPLLRYRMDDVLLPDPDGPQVFPFTKVKEVIGRFEDALIFTNQEGEDDFIHPLLIAELLVLGLHAWQVSVIDKASFSFRARFEPGMTRDEKEATRARIRQRLRAILAEKNMDNVSFDIQEVDSLSIDKRTGKFRLIVRNDEVAACTPRMETSQR